MSDRTRSQDFEDRSIEIDPEQERQMADLFRRTAPRSRSLDFESLECEPVSFFRRIPMTVRITVPLAAVVLLLACLLIWQPAQVDANMTFAEVQERLEQVKTITYRQKTIPSKQQVEEEPEIEKVFLLAPSTLRHEKPDGSYALMDLERGRSMYLDRKKKRVAIYEGIATITPEMKQLNFYELIRNIQGKAVSELPAKEIDGKKLPGFRAEREVSHPMMKQKLTVRMNVWVDPATKLPARIEELYPDPVGSDNYRTGTVMDQFVFDEPLDPELFSFDAPEGFTVESYGTGKLLPPEEDESIQKPVLTPKIGLGPVKFGMKRKEVEKLLGQPEKVVPAGGNSVSLEYYSRGYGMVVSEVLGVSMITVKSQQAFTVVRVRDFAGMTDKGVKIGATEEDVRKAHGEPSRVEDRTKEGGPRTMYYDDLNGWFSLWQGKVESMFFMIPRETKLKIIEERKKDEEQE
jgi:outer membrane lipoprotein-sorting protein